MTDTEAELRKAVDAVEHALRVVNGHSTTLPPPPMLPAVSRIPPEALAAVERVLAHRAGVVAEVVGQERWRQTTPQHQATKCATHASECLRGVVSDRDTGEHPLAHAAARALLGLALYLQRR